MLLSISENKDCYYMLNSIDKNRGTHGDSSFMLDGLPSSRENPLPLGMGSVNGGLMDCKIGRENNQKTSL